MKTILAKIRHILLDNMNAPVNILLIIIICAMLLIYAAWYGIARVSRGCIGDFDTYMICDRYAFSGQCALLPVDEWKLESSYMKIDMHRFKNAHDLTQFRNYRHSTLECLDTKSMR